MFQKITHTWPVALLLLTTSIAPPLHAQSLGSTRPPQAATAVERLMIEQIDQLVEAEQFDEALSSLQRLYDQGAGNLVERGGVHSVKTLRIQKHIPLREWCQLKTEDILDRHPPAGDAYLQQVNGAAEVALRSLQLSKSLVEAERAAGRYRLSDSRDSLGLLLVDLYLERGWSLAAIAALERIAPELRYQPTPRSLAWPLLWARPDGEANKTQLMASWREHSQIAPGPIDDERLLQVLKRLLIAAAMQPEVVDSEAIRGWVESLSREFEQSQQQELMNFVAESSAWQREAIFEWHTFAGNGGRAGRGKGKFDLAMWPEWQQQLEGYGTNSDRTNASKPRAGETNHGALPYHPVVADGRVYINEMNRIRAFDLKSGKPWPDVKPALPLFDSHLSAAAYVPLGYPLVGVPRGTLTVAEDCLYARMGSPVTGWANRESASDGGSLSYLVGLDLKKQGSMLRGFPLRLTEPEFSEAEFEGCPLVFGQMLLIPVVERDNVGIRRSVVAFDRLDGQLVWRSEVLAAGTVEGSERANLITHQLLTAAGGRLFYNTNLGSIVCLDPMTGTTEWLVQYSRFDKQKQAYPSPDRFRYRDLTPCLVAGGLVVCMPQDCAELFALDATSGDLVWSTDDLQVSDAIHILGVSGESLVVSGDRITWLNRRSGQILGRFPALVTPGIVNALPSPRGLGRGVMTANEVYWPTAGEIFVFDSDMAGAPNVDSPPIKRRCRIGSRGSGGGNLAIASGHLIFSAPSRLMVFDSLFNTENEISLNTRISPR